MKISIVTPTYNRGELLKKLYNSLLENLNSGLLIEWLIMDDGSNDNTKKIIEDFKKEKKIDIIYDYQNNQGKMVAINNIINKATGEILIEADSDDYFLNNSFKIIVQNIDKLLNNNKVYALVFPKLMDSMKQQFNKNNYLTTMFDLYFKDGFEGETTIVFKTNIRKKYSYKLEHGERFITESRMYHEIDLKYNILYFNSNIQKAEYKESGYTSNIENVFIKNPYGYYEYFRELINHSFKGVLINKKLYIYKHYILFTYLTKNKNFIKNIKNINKKIIILILYLPGIIKSKKFSKLVLRK